MERIKNISTLLKVFQNCLAAGLFFLFCSSTNAQHCGIVNASLKKFPPGLVENSSPFFYVFTDTSTFHNLDKKLYELRVKRELLSYFSGCRTDSILEEMKAAKVSKSNPNLQECQNLRLINYSELALLFERNISIGPDSMIQLPKHEYYAFHFSPIVFIEGYAVVQVTELVSPMWVVVNIFLLKEEEGEWKVVETLANFGS